MIGGGEVGWDEDGEDDLRVSWFKVRESCARSSASLSQYHRKVINPSESLACEQAPKWGIGRSQFFFSPYTPLGSLFTG